MNILEMLKAETVLAGAPILEQIAAFKRSLVYKTSDTAISYEDHFFSLKKEMDNIDRIALLPTIPPGGAQTYLIELATALEKITDDLEKSQTGILFFLGKVKSAASQKNSLMATFSAWYQVALAEKLKELDIKLPASSQKALGESEFLRILGDTTTEELISSLEVMLTHIKDLRKLAGEKYKLGVDQANASIVNLPYQGTNSSTADFSVLAKKWKVKDEVTPKRPEYDDEECLEIQPREPEETLDAEIEALSEPEPSYVETRQQQDPEIPLGIHKLLEAKVETSVVNPSINASELPQATQSWRRTIKDAFAGEVEIDTRTGTVSKEVQFDDEEDIPPPAPSSPPPVEKKRPGRPRKEIFFDDDE